jgi:hypothetical protein
MDRIIDEATAWFDRHLGPRDPVVAVQA